MSETSNGDGRSSNGMGNNVQELRESLLLSKAELARKAGVSALTIDRVEKGSHCRMDTKRKILLALGMKLSERREVFFDDSEQEVDFEKEEKRRTSEEMAQKVVAALTHSREKS